MSDPVEPVELRQGAQWAGKGDASDVRVEILGREYDGVLKVQRVAGVPGYMLRKPFPVEEQQLRAAYNPVTASGEVLDQWQLARDALVLLAQQIGVEFERLDDLGVGAFERGGHLGVFVPLSVLDRLWSGQ